MRFSKMAVAIDQHHGFKPFVRPPRCKLQSYSQLDYAMLEFSQKNHGNSLRNALDFSNIHKSFSTPCLSLSTKVEEDDANPRIEIISGHGAPKARALVVEVAIALASGLNPEPVASGLGGAYFMRARSGDTIAVAKPVDEEPLAVNNPKGFAGRMLGQPGMRRSIRVGEAGVRELAAYLLDHDSFAGVPPTALVKISHVKFNVNNAEPVLAPQYKIASLQRFIHHDSDAGDLGPSGFSVTSIHRIGILDIRLLNLDRHAGNILVKQGQDSYAVGAADLVPIDHGLCLPESLDDPYFEWLHWPQASIPFSESEVDYICNLDPFKDAELLRAQLPSIRESSIRVLLVCTIFLKRAASSGLCLADIGEMMTREFHGGEENWSLLENICLNAKAKLRSFVSDQKCIGSQETEEDEMFHLEDDYEALSSQASHNECSQNSLMKGKAPKFPRFLSERSLSTLDGSFDFKEDCCKNYDENTSMTDEAKEIQGDNRCDNHKLSSLTRSVSFAVPNYSNDSGGISFEELSNEEWELFLDTFENLLPETFEGRKCMCLSKQRLGNSCEF